MQTTEPRFCHMEDQQRRNVKKKRDSGNFMDQKSSMSPLVII